MTAVVVVVVVVVVAAAVATLAFLRLGDAGEERWHNPELFLARSDPISRGETVVARYRARPRTPGGAAGASVVAALRCEEVLHESGRSVTVVDRPLGVVDYSTVDLIEADIQVTVPVADVPSTLETSAASVRWTVAVEVDAPDGTRAEIVRPIVVGAAVAV